MAADIGAIAEVIAQAAGSNGGAVIVAALPPGRHALDARRGEFHLADLHERRAPAGTVIGIDAAGLATVVDAPRTESGTRFRFTG